MKICTSFVCCIVLINLPGSESIFEAIAIGGGAAVLAAVEGTRCKFFECCTEDESWFKNRWIRTELSDLLDLEKDLRTKLYGQPLAHDIVMRALKAHLLDDDPKKPLVMSFHGWTGGGKNFVSNMIAERLYKKGLKSKYVHVVVATEELDNPTKINENKEKLQQRVRENAHGCGRQLFIFDEVDKIPPGVLDGIKPFLDYRGESKGVDFRKCIFIFISNAGGKDISKVTYEYWLNGKDRSKIAFTDLESYIRLATFNEEGGLKNSDLLEKHLIDYYVPFLPLEKKHVKQCVEDFIEKKGYKDVEENVIDEIAESLEYYPDDIKLYAKSGCKRIHTRVPFYVKH